ncbi:TIGR02452 family protein [Planomonospora parontospora]|uniref:TIGR02452 family protein n=1 Tax=Planomonospora parontospora TaxID=58119 RepID=UPI001670837B|nr:TIGR02452 family protein [Planomonospora parontospora]GGL56004.1 TIGR02452 family protein [Planomonospora parontospora subsp. antibiotica]GII18723.1 TIGR02452 family protein [Planomonospora parontospora subsp. antibiotica]
MRRDGRRALAAETVEILERGWYADGSGRRVSVADRLAASVAGTRLWTPDDLTGLLAAHEGRSGGRAPEAEDSVSPCRMEVVNETSLSAARRLVDGGDPVGCLNFASAKNPGGGFLNGSEAQEESLARSSGLYHCLVGVPDFYDFHRSQGDPLYSHRAIFSPGVPVFRDDRGGLLAQPYPVSFVTAAAPNAGAMRGDGPRLERLPEVLSERAARVLALFAASGVRRLVLGAWGCGVFRNPPELVASVFAGHLGPGGAFRGTFDRVVFAVLDRSPGTPAYDAFARTFQSLA